MGPDNSPPKAGSTNPPKPGTDSVPPQASVKAEIVENIPVTEQATENVASDQLQPPPQPEDKKLLDRLKTPPKLPAIKAPPQTSAKSYSPLLAITIASLVAAVLAVAAFFAFRSY